MHVPCSQSVWCAHGSYVNQLSMCGANLDGWVTKCTLLQWTLYWYLFAIHVVMVACHMKWIVGSTVLIKCKRSFIAIVAGFLLIYSRVLPKKKVGWYGIVIIIMISLMKYHSYVSFLYGVRPTTPLFLWLCIM